MIIGLTGGIATGKSTVASFIEAEGIPIVDADIVAREVVLPQEEAYERIVAKFGSGIVRADKMLNREKLGEIVFRDETMRKKLNEIVHPAVRERMKQQADKLKQMGHPLIVLDIPLLIESDLFHMVDKVLLVYVSSDIQLKRLMERNGYSEEEASQRIEAQISISEKKLDSRVSNIIDNSGTLTETKNQVRELLHKWRQKER